MMAQGDHPILSRRVALETRRGDPVLVGTTSVTPEARVLLVRLSFAALVWNRPVAVIVERDGVVTRQPIRDLSRLAMFVPCTFFFLLVASLRRLHLKRKDCAR